VDEREAMTRALDLAWRGWGRVQPNPLVGAVVLAGNHPVGEGWHAELGDRHAETVALAAAGERARGATVVVTLEPCAHQGRQPPCTDALIRAGVRRVVAALPDPNPVAAGGAARLRDAGIDVELGLLGDAAAAQNAVFLHRMRDPSRPFVALKLATTIDAKIADANGNSRWISGESARDYVHWLRAGFDAIAVGGVTARTDDPELTVRGPLRPRVAPIRVVFAVDADLPTSLGLVRTAGEVPTVAFVGELAPARRVESLEGSGVQVERVGDLGSALTRLGARGIVSLLVEGGGHLAGALLADGLVDRYYWVQSPLWLGAGGTPAMAGLPSVHLAGVNRWTVAERRALGQDTLLVLDRS
jgi:diaminohydroxyphosphoribosylaminopyrimidine deaminase / 5-amino-6-(5-phosphoribosylamino)uracil reductase